MPISPYTIINPPDVAPINSSYGFAFQGANPTDLFPVIQTVTSAIHLKLKTLLLTRKGERVMQPEYGTLLEEILFEQNTDNLKVDVIEALTDPIRFWIPEIELQNIEVITPETDMSLDNTLKIIITYSAASVNNATLTLIFDGIGNVFVNQGVIL